MHRIAALIASFKPLLYRAGYRLERKRRIRSLQIRASYIEFIYLKRVIDRYFCMLPLAAEITLEEDSMDSKILRNVLAGLSIAGLLTGVATPGNSASG